MFGNVKSKGILSEYYNYEYMSNKYISIVGLILCCFFYYIYRFICENNDGVFWEIN